MSADLEIANAVLTDIVNALREAGAAGVIQCRKELYRKTPDGADSFCAVGWFYYRKTGEKLANTGIVEGEALERIKLHNIFIDKYPAQWWIATLNDSFGLTFSGIADRLQEAILSGSASVEEERRWFQCLSRRKRDSSFCEALPAKQRRALLL